MGGKISRDFLLSKTSGEKKLVGGQLVGQLEQGKTKLDTELVITFGIVAMQRQ